ncbi:MAG: sugar phosphate isomerase/epimerase family protein [bacterium]
MELFQKYFKPGIIHFMAFPQTMRGEGPILETIEEIVSDEFFSAIEISWIKDEKIREEARKLIETSGMTVAYGAQPRLLTQNLDISSLDEATRTRAVEEVKRSIEEAEYIGAVGVAFLAGKDPGPEKRELAKDALVKSICELCDYAKTHGNLRVELEVFDFDVEKNSLVGPSIVAREIAQRIKRERKDNFGLLIDLSHFPQQYESIRDAVYTTAGYVTHVHLGNCIIKDKSLPGYGDQHPRFGIKGGENGVKEVREFLRALFDIGFFDSQDKPIVSFEVKPLPGENPKAVIANAKRTLLEAWAEL